MFSTKYKKLSYLPKFLVRSMVMVSSQKLSKHMYTHVMILSVWLVLKQNVDFILILNYVVLWSSLTILRINFLTFLRYWQHESRDGGSRQLVVSHVWLPLGYLDVDFFFFTSKWHSILYQPVCSSWTWFIPYPAITFFRSTIYVSSIRRATTAVIHYTTDVGRRRWWSHFVDNFFRTTNVRFR